MQLDLALVASAVRTFAAERKTRPVTVYVHNQFSKAINEIRLYGTNSPAPISVDCGGIRYGISVGVSKGMAPDLILVIDNLDNSCLYKLQTTEKVHSYDSGIKPVNPLYPDADNRVKALEKRAARYNRLSKVAI